ncbi:hypothetical protein C1J03_08670 [Sulfitobacter sp. SK012]|uniref:hypothetical protein n=1 Tax=Sulfitobacter sp. SK012 TaxID=1389005 RepID=UPI000E0A0E33|nr:hypothetical protein [Sulfitobacter sp. SK012]AXI46083.1 hypothetical protein C1J03_08670 [Sulfitobacter sp. SK012]
MNGTKPAPILDQKHVTDYLANSYQRREELAQQMSAAGETPFIVFFEDIYNQPAEVGKALLLRLFTFLDIDPADHSEYDALVNDALFNRGQKTSSVLEKVPNIEELRAKLDTLSNGFDKVFIPS